MKKIVLLFIAFSFLSVFAQNTVIKNKTNTQEQKISPEEMAKSYWGPYMRELEQKIKGNWNPPKDGVTKRVVVIFTIGRDGKFLDKKITKSSGNKNADSAALRAIELTAPFRPLPKEFEGDSVPIEFTFDYNVLNTVIGDTHYTPQIRSYDIKADDSGMYITPSSDILLWFKNKSERKNQK